jgi:DNA-binding transcriptional LysR family regulator
VTTSGPNLHHVNWDDLRTALFLARAGSIRKAARELGVSHSTVLRRLRALEEAVGVELFVNKGDGYEATPAGQDVFDTATTLDEAVTGLERRVSGHDFRLTGPVRVTIPDPLVPLVFPIFSAFSREQPGIEVTLALGAGFVDLAHRAADVAIRITGAPPPDLVGQRVCNVNVGIYGSEAYLRGRNTKSLASLDWVSLERGSDMAFAKWIETHLPNAHIALRVGQPWGLREAVDAGAGVGLMPCALGESMPGWRRIKLVPEISAPLWVLSHRDLRTTTRVRVLRDFVVNALRAKRALIEGKPQK